MRSIETGKPLRRTAEESQEVRMRNKLIGKTTWFKQKKKNKDEKEQHQKGANYKSGSQAEWGMSVTSILVNTDQLH